MAASAQPQPRISFASGSLESYTVRYFQDLSGPFDVTWINQPHAVQAKDIFGNSIDFNKDGLTDSIFSSGLVNQIIGYTQSPQDSVIAATRLSQSEIAFGDGRSGSKALRILNDIGPDGSRLADFPYDSGLVRTIGADKHAVFDINGDGFQDIFSVAATTIATSTPHARAVTWLYNPASGLFDKNSLPSFPAGLGGTGEATFNDFNGDGAIDLVWTDYIDIGLGGERIAPSAYTLYFGETNGAGGWNLQFGTSGDLAPITFDVDTIPRAENLTTSSDEGIPDVTPVARDFNGDGSIDLAIGTQTGIRVYTNPGNGRFDPNSGTNIAGLSEGFFLKAADFNNDGLLDLVSSPNSNAPGDTGSDASLTLYLNISTGGAANFRSISLDGLKGSVGTNGPIATGDMNLDGNVDLILSSRGSDSTKFYVLLGEGNGSFDTPIAFTGYSNLADPLVPINADNRFRAVLDIDTGDFNGDGQLDVLTLAGSSLQSESQAVGINHIYGVAYNRTFTPPSITTTQLPAGQAGVLYSAQLQATGGDSTRDYSFQLSPANLLPDGLSLQPNGTISGIPQRSGSFTFAAEVSQSNGLKGNSSSIDVDFTASSGGGIPGGNGSIGGGGSNGGASAQPPTTPGTGNASTPGLDNDNLDESSQNNNGIVIDANKDGIPDANQSNVAGIRRVGDGTSPGDYAALAVAAKYTLNAISLLPITNNQVQVSLPSGGSVSTPIPSGVTALLEPLEFYVENVTPGATIEAELFIPDNFGQQTDAYMRFNYITKRFEEYVDVNGGKLYQLLDENADGKVDRVVFSLTDGDPRWDGDGLANGVIIDPGSPIDAQLRFSGRHQKDSITGNLLGNTINGKAGNDHLFGDLGKDRIRGGKGRDHINGGEHGDLLIGGRGRDRFIYTSAADSSAENPNQQDEIRRFHHQDRLDLRRFDGDTTKTGQQAFAFIGARSFSGTAGALRFHAGLLSADLDGDRTADFAVAIDGSLKASQLML